MKAPKLVAQTEEKSVVLDTLPAQEAEEFRDRAKAIRLTERKLGRLKSELEDYTEALRVRLRKKGILWKRVTGIEEDTGEVMGKPEPTAAKKP